MWPSAEVRWFRRGRIPEDVLTWFVTDFPLLEEQPPRVDVYFPLVTDDGVGIKLREGRIEIKQRYGDLGVMVFSAGMVGIPELWRKWAFGLATPGVKEDVYGNGANLGSPDGWIPVQKTRLVRNYALAAGSQHAVAVPATLSPARGCSMELTQVVAGGSEEWWTVGFEATGAEPELATILEIVARQTLGHSGPLRFDLEQSYGYPRWLKQPGR